MSKNKRPRAHLIALALLISIPSSATAQSPHPSPAQAEMTVREVHSVLASPTTSTAKDLMNKNILLRAMVLEQYQVRTMQPAATQCSNYLILVDQKSNVEKRFRELRWDERAPFLRTIPHLLTTEVTPGGEGGSVLPTKAGLYRGMLVSTGCRESPVRFRTDEKVKEIPLETQTAPALPAASTAAEPPPGR